jgi:hypothetical protein
MQRIRIDGHADQQEDADQEGIVFKPDFSVPQKPVHDMNLYTKIPCGRFYSMAAIKWNDGIIGLWRGIGRINREGREKPH